MLLRVRKNGQMTIPAEVRTAARLKEGDLLEVRVDEEGTIVMVPMELIDRSQAWFWTEAWQAGEREADLNIERGEVARFDNVEDAIRDLNEDETLGNP